MSDVTDITTVISQENYSEKIKLLEQKLVEFELKQKEIMTAVLLVEEVFCVSKERMQIMKIFPSMQH